MQRNSNSSPRARYRLFDLYGLPWTSSLSWYWLYVITVITGFTFASFLGIYLGLWLKTKGRGLSVLALYLAITALAVLMFFPPKRTHLVNDIVLTAILLLWFAAAYLLRQKVIGYYSDGEGRPFRINPVLAGILSVWYINGCLRADFPLDETGNTSEGVLKLSV